MFATSMAATMFLMRLKGRCMMPCVCYLRLLMTVEYCLVGDGLRW